MLMNYDELDIFLPEDRPRRLEQLRKKQKLDKGEVAKAIGVSSATYGRMESGGIDSVSAKNLKALAELYHVSSDFLLGLTDNPEPTYADIGELGISVEAAKFLLSEKANPDVVNELLLNKNFRVATKLMSSYFSGQQAEANQQRNDLIDFSVSLLEEELEAGNINDADGLKQDIRTLKADKITYSKYELDQIINKLEVAIREIKRKCEAEIAANGLKQDRNLNRKAFALVADEYKSKALKNLSIKEKADMMTKASVEVMRLRGASEPVIKAVMIPMRGIYRVVALLGK